MLCVRCGSDNETDNRFCDGCGEVLHPCCPDCQHPNRAGARFCGACGAAVHPGQPAPEKAVVASELSVSASAVASLPDGERRQVTVLFADIRSSTELIQGLDPEEAADRLDPGVRAMVDAVRRFGGTVTRVQGDGIMALFGAPTAQEDHAGHACLAAWAMLRAVAELKAEPISVRVGLNTGEVVVRPLGNDLTIDYDAVGLTAHVAHRVEQLCTPGRAWMTAATFRASGGFATGQSLGAVKIKGLAHSAELYELTSVAAKRDRWEVRASTHTLTPFVGRQAELTLLVDAQLRARRGRGQIVTILGDAGMGKSRLVHEFLQRHCGDDVSVFRIGATLHDLSTPYLFVADLLRCWVKVEDDDDKATVEKKLQSALAGLTECSPLDSAALRWVLDLPVGDPDWAHLDPRQRRERIVHAIKALILQSAAKKPLILVAEDAHWLDSESQTVLDAIVEALGAVRLLLLVTHRPEFQHLWARRGYHSAIRVSPLESDCADDFIQRLLGDTLELQALRRRIVERADGMPLFIEEMARSLVESGVLADEEKLPLTRRLEAIEIPHSVRAILAARIDRLSSELRRRLQMAAVVGHDVPFALLKAVAGETEEQLRRGLAELQDLEFLYEVDPPAGSEYTFKHALTQTVAYEALLVKRRRGYHAQVLRAIEDAYPDRIEEFTERLAHHSLRAEDWRKAVEYLFRAGKRANERAAHGRAVELFEQALDALSRLPDTEMVDYAIEVRLGLRVALGPTADYRRILRHLEEAEPLVRAAGDGTRLASIHISRSTFLGLSGSLTEAQKAGLSGLELAEQLDDAALRMNARFALGQSYAFRGEFDKALAILEPDMDQLTGPLRRAYVGTTGTPSVLGLTSLAITYSLRGQFSNALECSKQALAIAGETQRPYDLSYAGLAQGVTLLTKGEVQLSMEHLEGALHQCRAAEIQILFPSIARFLGQAYALDDRPELGLELLESAMAQCESKSLGIFHAWCAASLGLAHLHRGSAETELKTAEALALARRYEARPVEGQALRIRAGALAASFSNQPAAERTYRKGISLAELLGMRPELGHMRLGLGTLFARTQRISAACEQLGAAKELYAELDMKPCALRASALLDGLRDRSGSFRENDALAAAPNEPYRTGDAA